jgi:cytochrome P450
MAQITAPRTQSALPTASMRDTLGVVSDVMLPTLAKGVIIRRKQVVNLSERLDLDRRAVRRMQQIRNRYGEGPLLLRLPFRTQALILDPEHVHRVLNGAPEPFAPASSEKQAALAHFQPRGVLVSHGIERAERRRFNEEVLDDGQPMHRLAEPFRAVVDEEAALLLGAVRHRQLLTWDDFALTWFRVVRRVVFGDAARNDHALTEVINRLRSDANWAFLKPRRSGLRHQLSERIGHYLAMADPYSLAGVMAATPHSDLTAPEQQVPQWLFAFDPAGMTTFRTLALLASHPEHAAQVQEDIDGRAAGRRPALPYLRACVLESLRLWPTTPAVLRQSSEATVWANGVLPARAGLLIFTPFFHRDDQRLPYANQFTPELWLQVRTDKDWPLIPFSSGPARCPGRKLVLMLTSMMLAALLDGRRIRLQPPNRLDARQALPGTLSPYNLRFTFDDVGREGPS